MVYQFFKGSGGISFVDWLVGSGGGLRLKGKLTPGKFISFFFSYELSFFTTVIAKVVS